MGKLLDSYTIHVHALDSRNVPDLQSFNLKIDCNRTPYQEPLPKDFSYFDFSGELLPDQWSFHLFMFCENLFACQNTEEFLKALPDHIWLRRVDSLKELYFDNLRWFYSDGDPDGSFES